VVPAAGAGPQAWPQPLSEAKGCSAAATSLPAFITRLLRAL